MTPSRHKVHEEKTIDFNILVNRIFIIHFFVNSVLNLCGLSGYIKHTVSQKNNLRNQENIKNPSSSPFLR